jgi:hypothetical protein
VNNTGTLVSQNHGFSENEVSDSSVVEVVDVRAADTGGLDLDQNVFRADLRNGSLKGRIDELGS